MREHLFRGKNFDGEWMYGSLIDPGNHEQTVIFPTHDAASSLGVVELVRYTSRAVECETVGEWTGLMDRNGQKIYEGDIVLGFDFSPEDDGYGVVEWGDGGFLVSNRCFCGSFIENYDGRDFEVVGNIHDDPELLEE